MGDRYGRSGINEMSMGLSVWNMVYRCGIWHIDMVNYHIDKDILDIDVGYGLMIWEMTVSTWSAPISIWDILSLWFDTFNLHRPTWAVASVFSAVAVAFVFIAVASTFSFDQSDNI